jgi:hypothetical protein
MTWPEAFAYVGVAFAAAWERRQAVMEDLKITAAFTALVLFLALIYAFVTTRKHYTVIDSGIQNGYIYTVYQHLDGTKIGCYNTVERPQDPSKCYNIKTKEAVPFPENDVK